MGGAAWTVVTAQAEIPWEPALFLLASFVTWTTAELKAEEPPKPTLHPHDVALGENLRSLFSSRLRGLLRDHDFGNSFDFTDIEPIGDVSRWEAPMQEFVSEELNRKLDEIVQCCTEIYRQIVEEGRPMDRGHDTWTFATEEERYSDFYGKATLATIGQVNRRTTRLLELVHDFERLFRRLSPDSYSEKRKSSQLQP